MLYAIVAVIALILDQAMKYWTTLNIALDTGYKDIIPGFIGLENVHNYGAAFSILQNARWFFVILTLIFAIAVIVILRMNIVHGKLGRWSLVMVLAGAIGNGIDRLIKGYVVDMFHFEFSLFGIDFSKFPIFNIADIFITVGGVIFCLYIIFYKDPLEGFKGSSEKGKTAPAKKREVRREAPRREAPRREKPAEQSKSAASDPENPFAEWLGPKREYSAPAQGTAPAAAPAAPEAEVQALHTDSDEVIAALPKEKEPERAAASPPAAEEFSLDDILDEFRELD